MEVGRRAFAANDYERGVQADLVRDIEIARHMLSDAEALERSFEDFVGFGIVRRDPFDVALPIRIDGPEAVDLWVAFGAELTHDCGIHRNRRHVGRAHLLIEEMPHRRWPYQRLTCLTIDFNVRASSMACPWMSLLK